MFSSLLQKDQNAFRFSRARSSFTKRAFCVYSAHASVVLTSLAALYTLVRSFASSSSSSVQKNLYRPERGLADTVNSLLVSVLYTCYRESISDWDCSVAHCAVSAGSSFYKDGLVFSVTTSLFRFAQDIFL